MTVGWDLGVVQLVVQVVVLVNTLTLLNITVQEWGVDLLVTGDWGDQLVVLVVLVDELTSLPADGGDVTDGLVDLWGDVLLLDEVLEELLADEDITVDDLLADWENLVNWGDDLLVDWDNLFVNLNINDPWLIDDNTFSGDWLNNNLLLWENPNISVDFSHWLNNGLTLEQSSEELLKKELVVDFLSLGVRWVVLLLLLLSVDGWESVGKSVVHILLSVNVWQDIPVPHDEVLKSLTSIDSLSVDLFILTTEGGGWESVLVLEKLDNGVDVLVEEDGVDKVLTEGRELPEALEVDGGNVPLEDWVLDVLTEEGDVQVLLEELSVVDLFEGKDLVNIIDSPEGILSLDEVPLFNWQDVPEGILSADQVPLFNWQDFPEGILSSDEVPLLYWQNAFGGKISDDRPFNRKTLNSTLAQPLLQQQIVNNWTLVQQGSLPD